MEGTPTVLSSTPTMSHTFRKVFPHLQHISGRVTAEYRTSSCHVRISQCWCRRSAAKRWTFVSDQIMFWEATWLNFNLTLSVYFSQGLQTVFPFRKLKDWQSRDRKPFFSVISIRLGRDFPLLKFTKPIAVCIMHGFFFFISVVWLQ